MGFEGARVGAGLRAVATAANYASDRRRLRWEELGKLAEEGERGGDV